MRRPAPKLDLDGLWQYALRALAGRSLSIGEIKAKLSERARSAADVAQTLAKLKEYGMIDDRRLADTYAAARLENQGFGRARVVQDLRRRRVAPSLAEDAVSRAYQGTDETAMIEAFLARKYRKVDLATHFGDPRKLAAAYRRLRHAGFSGATAIRVLRRYAESAEALE
ncbi:MAG: regulatory protein RecX, partial [Bryobacteraceae bacterium]